MDIEEFEDFLDRFGEDLSAWPQPARTDAQSLLAQSAEARDILAVERAMHRALRPDPAVRAPAGLVDRIVHQAHLQGGAPSVPAVPPRPVVASRLREFILAFRPAILLPLCFLIGLVVGLLPSDGPSKSAAIDLPSLFQGCCGDRSAY